VILQKTSEDDGASQDEGSGEGNESLSITQNPKLCFVA
jgi:hypothetical protein